MHVRNRLYMYSSNLHIYASEGSTFEIFKSMHFQVLRQAFWRDHLCHDESWIFGKKKQNIYAISISSIQKLHACM